MYIFKQINPLKTKVNQLKSQGLSVGFVPTMGALHDGHLKLLETAIEKTDRTFCSIFVNPTQFNEASDLEKYPRTPEKDIDKLLSIGCDVLFMPSVSEIYPDPPSPPLAIDFQGLDERLEGQFRPGHFAGVATVVHRLLEIVEPDALFMGQKDYQQVQIVGQMIEQTQLPVQLHMEPIVREESGLAMSSRNVRLSEQGKVKAALIAQVLQWVKAHIEFEKVNLLKEYAIKQFEAVGFRPEYFEIVDGKNMLPIEAIASVKSAVACTAVWVEDVRLIDNIILK